MTTPVTEMFEEAASRCEFGFLIERDPPGDPGDEQIELSVDDDVEYRAIASAIVNDDGRAILLEAGVDNDGPFVSVKGVQANGEPENLSLMDAGDSVLINLDGRTPSR